MFGALLPDEAETFVGLLRRVAETLNVERAPVGGSNFLHSGSEAYA
jgi:hypothetical protein